MRSARLLRTAPRRANFRQARLESTSPSAQVQQASRNSGLIGGVAGGALVFAVSISYYLE